MKKQNEQRLEPKLRFKGFTDDWEQRKLKDILKVNSGRDYKHLATGDIPVYGTGGLIARVDDFLSNQPAVGLGRKGTIDNPFFLEPPFWTVDTLFYLTSEKDNHINFIFYLLLRIRWKKYDESTGVPSLSKKTIENINVFSTKFEEQIKIAKILEKINDLINLHKRKGILLKFLRDFYLYLFFQQNFFNNNTESIKLKDITEITTGNLNANDAVKNGLYNFYTCSKEVLKTDRYAFEGNALTVAGNGDVGHIKQVSGRFNAYQRTYVIQNLKADFDYLYYELYTKLPKQIHRETAKGVMPYIVMGTLSELLVDLPSKDKQEKISSYLNMINKLINEQEMKVDRLKSLKQLYLEKLFI